MEGFQPARTGNAARRRTRRLGTWLTGSGAVLLGVLMALSSSTAAVHPGVTLKAPYVGTLASAGNSGQIGGCSAKVANPVKATWTPKNGTVTMSGSATAHGCPGVNQGSSANVGNSITIGIPIPITMNGTHTITVLWTWHAALPTTLHVKGKCPSPVISSSGYGSSYCDASARSNLYGYLHLEDLTNGSYWYANNYWGGVSNGSDQSTSEYCYSGTCSFYNSTGHTVGGAGPGSFTWWVNATLSKGDKVIVVLYVDAYSYASAYGYPVASATAGYNLASVGYWGKIASITVT